MPAKPKLSPEEWASVRAKWEGDPRTSVAWLVSEMGLPCSDEAVRQRYKAEGWIKGGKQPVAAVPSKPSKVGKADKAKPAKALAKLEPVKKKAKNVKLGAETKLGKGAAKLGGGDAPKLRGRGRPTLYRDEFVELGHNLCLIGFNDVQLAEHFEIDLATLNRWKIAYPNFCESLINGKAVADGKVARSLYERAMGYSHPEEKIFCQDGAIIKANTIKHYPPEVGAAKMWLNNRQPKHWRERVEVQHEGELRLIPWDAIREISRQQLAVAEEKHLSMIEGRAERVGFEPDEDDALADGD